jgi:hypothetical protein
LGEAVTNTEELFDPVGLSIVNQSWLLLTVQLMLETISKDDVPFPDAGKVIAVVDTSREKSASFITSSDVPEQTNPP